MYGFLNLSILSAIVLVSSHPSPQPLPTPQDPPAAAEVEENVEEKVEQEFPPTASDSVGPLDADAFVEDLKKHVMSVPILAFEGDAILLQFPDPLNRRTSYRHLDPWAAIAEPVYETKGNDAGLPVVILTSDEDNIPLPKGDKVKRTYVILRRAIQLHPRVYFVAYLYITEAPENTPGIHNLGGRKVFLEWDFWDHRESVDVRAKSLENAFRCSNNIFVPCASNETMDFPKPTQRPEEFINGPDTGYPAANPKIEERFHVADGYDPDEFMDIYGDLDKEIRLGRDANEIPNDAQLPAPYLGRGDVFSGLEINLGGPFDEKNGDSVSIVVVVKNVVRVVLDTTLGLVKNFEGLYGGLGTIDAELANVGLEAGIEGTDDLENGNLLSEDEKQMLDAEIREMGAGGLGGMVTGAEGKEAPLDFTIDQVNDVVNPILAKGRALGAAWDPPGGEEKPYVQFGWLKTNGAQVANDIYVGFGGCRYHKVKPEEIDSVQKTVAGAGVTTTMVNVDVEEHLRIYQRALRTQCVSYEADFLLEILKCGLLKVGDDKSFELQEKSLHFTYEKLTVKQLKELLRGVQLATFSKVYNSELRSPTASPVAPDGSPLSRSVYTLGQVVIGGTGFSQENIWVDMRHGFKLNRNTIRTLKIAYVKLLEDKELLGEGDSGFEKELNYNNRVYVMGLIQYLLRGSAPVYNTGVNPFKNFEEFYTRNKQVIEDRVTSRMA